MSSQSNSQEGRPFLTFFLNRIEEIKAGRALTRRGGQYSKKGQYSYGTAIKYVDLYEKKTETIYPEVMDEEWFEGFIIFLNGKPLRRNTISSVIRRVKTVLRRQCRVEKKPFLALDVTYGPELTIRNMGLLKLFPGGDSPVAS